MHSKCYISEQILVVPPPPLILFPITLQPYAVMTEQGQIRFVDPQSWHLFFPASKAWVLSSYLGKIDVPENVLVPVGLADSSWGAPGPFYWLVAGPWSQPGFLFLKSYNPVKPCPSSFKRCLQPLPNLYNPSSDGSRKIRFDFLEGQKWTYKLSTCQGTKMEVQLG